MVLGALSALLEIESDLEVVGEARNGSEALALALKHHPDVVVTDIEMPGMTGLDLAAALREHERAPRVIILTTFARPGLPAARARRRRVRLPAEGRAVGAARRRDPPRRRRRPRDRSVARRRSVDRTGSADRSRTPGAAPRRRRAVGRRDRASAEAVRRHRPQLPVRSDRQARRPQPRRSRTHGTPEGLALNHGASSIALATDRFNHRWRPSTVARTHPPLPKLRDGDCFAIPCGPGDVVSASSLEKRERSRHDRRRVDDPDIRDVGQRHLPVSPLTDVDRRQAANVDLSLDRHNAAAWPRHGLHLPVRRSPPNTTRQRRSATPVMIFVRMFTPHLYGSPAAAALNAPPASPP